METCLIFLRFKYIIYHSHNICLHLTFQIIFIIFIFHLFSITPSGLILHSDSIHKDNHVSICTFCVLYLQDFYINNFKIDFKWLQKKKI